MLLSWVVWSCGSVVEKEDGKMDGSSESVLCLRH